MNLHIFYLFFGKNVDMWIHYNRLFDKKRLYCVQNYKEWLIGSGRLYSSMLVCSSYDLCFVFLLLFLSHIWSTRVTSLVSLGIATRQLKAVEWHEINRSEAYTLAMGRRGFWWLSQAAIVNCHKAATFFKMLYAERRGKEKKMERTVWIAFYRKIVACTLFLVRAPVCVYVGMLVSECVSEWVFVCVYTCYILLICFKRLVFLGLFWLT